MYHVHRNFELMKGMYRYWTIYYHMVVNSYNQMTFQTVNRHTFIIYVQADFTTQNIYAIWTKIFIKECEKYRSIRNWIADSMLLIISWFFDSIFLDK